MANAWVATSRMLLLSANGTFEFLNDSGSDIEAGAAFTLDDGTDKHVAIVQRRVENGRVGALQLAKPRNIYLAPYATAANVAVGAIMSMDATNGDVEPGTSGIGKYVALPKQAGTMIGASAAAASGDTGIIVFEK